MSAHNKHETWLHLPAIFECNAFMCFYSVHVSKFTSLISTKLQVENCRLAYCEEVMCKKTDEGGQKCWGCKFCEKPPFNYTYHFHELTLTHSLETQTLTRREDYKHRKPQ